MVGDNVVVIWYKDIAFKCKENREIIDPKWRVTANKRNLCEGKCIECGGNVSRMGGIATLDINTDDKS